MRKLLLFAMLLCAGCSTGSQIAVDAFDKDFPWDKNASILILGDVDSLREALMKEFRQLGVGAVTYAHANLVTHATIKLSEDEREVVDENYDPQAGVYSAPGQDTDRRHEYLKTVRPKKRVKVTEAMLTITSANKVIYQTHHEFPVALRGLDESLVARTLLAPLAEHLKK